MTIEQAIGPTEQLHITQTALEKARDKRRRVDHLATAGDYPTRAAARIQLEDVDADIARLEAEQGQLQAAADREAQIVRLQQLAADGAVALADVEAARLAFDQAVTPLLERYSAAVMRQRTARSAFYATLGTLDPAELAGADLRGVLTNITDFRARDHDVSYVFEPSHYPGALSVALREEAHRRVPLWPDTVVLCLPLKEVTHE